MKKKSNKYDEQIRLVCPLCPTKEYKTLLWYSKHCIKEHGKLMPFLTRTLIDKRTIDFFRLKLNYIEKKITRKLQHIEKKINNIPKTTVTIPAEQHDIDIKSIKKPKKPIPKSIEENYFSNCIKELTEVFQSGIKILKKMEDFEKEETQKIKTYEITLGIKRADILTKEELTAYQKKAQENWIKIKQNQAKRGG